MDRRVNFYPGCQFCSNGVFGFLGIIARVRKGISMWIKAGVLLLSSLFFFPLTSLAAISAADRSEIRQGVQAIERSLEKGDLAEVSAIISPHALPGLKNEIEDVVDGKKIHFEQRISKWEEVSSSSVKLTGSFSASGSGWNANGIKNYFIWKRVLKMINQFFNLLCK